MFHAVFFFFEETLTKYYGRSQSIAEKKREKEREKFYPIKTAYHDDYMSRAAHFLSLVKSTRRKGLLEFSVTHTHTQPCHHECEREDFKSLKGFNGCFKCAIWIFVFFLFFVAWPEPVNR
jgi:hypothetical protein